MHTNRFEKKTAVFSHQPYSDVLIFLTESEQKILTTKTTIGKKRRKDLLFHHRLAGGDGGLKGGKVGMQNPREG